MKIIAISGMMGTGKTTLAQQLSKLSGWPVVREDVQENRFLGPFYQNMERWALASQLSFLLSKTLAFEHSVTSSPDVILIDRTIQEDLHVFGAVLKSYDVISDAEYQLLQGYGKLLSRSWRTVDFTIYLEDTDENCYQRVLSRADALESKIELGYVKRLGLEYRNWRANFLQTPYCELRSAEVDFRQLEKAEKVLEDIREMTN